VWRAVLWYQGRSRVVPEWYQGRKGVQNAILSIANAYAARAFAVSRLSGQAALVAAWIVNGRMEERGVPRFLGRLRANGTKGASRTAPICSRVQRVVGEGLVTVFPPVGLDEHAIDLFEVHDAGLVAHRLDQRAQARVAGAPHQALAGANDECQGPRG
jgi:hypothetical protein